jgi:hypothetical protein
MTTPSTGAPQPRPSGKAENLPDPVEAVEAAAYEPAQDEKDPHAAPEEATPYRPAED